MDTNPENRNYAMKKKQRSPDSTINYKAAKTEKIPSGGPIDIANIRKNFL